MFDALGALLEGLWNALKAIIQGTWNVLLQGWTWAVALIVVIVGCVTEIVNTIVTLLSQMAGALAALVLPQSSISQSTGNILAVANYFFPVEEMLALLTALSVIWVVMLSYRLVKSWIPTLS